MSISLIDVGSGTTNTELNNEAKRLKLKHFRGVFMKDELKNIKPLEQECGIINSQPSYKNNGHWCCWWKDNNQKYYFDSYGIKPLKEVYTYLKSPVIYSTYQIQQFNDSNCGQWCLYVLNELNKGKDYIDIILNIINNEHI